MSSDSGSDSGSSSSSYSGYDEAGISTPTICLRIYWYYWL
jgi:hypothetical protein